MSDSGTESKTSRIRTSAPWKKLMAAAIVLIMVASAFALVTPSVTKTVKAPSNDKQVSSQVGGGSPKITYAIYDIGNSYLKPTDYSKLGRSDHSKPGINEWFIPRNTNYNDTIVHNSYPYVIAYNGYSANLANQAKYKYLTASWTTHSFYTLKEDAENITKLATGVNQDPWIVPIMLAGGQAVDGGWVNMSMYQNYLTDQEYADIQNGVHYANTFYGVDAANFSAAWKGNANDGWLSEIQGHWDFNRNAAHKFLGLPAAGDLRTEFNATGAANIAWGWRAEWIADGDVGGPLDIYACYDFSLLTGNGPVTVYVKLDTLNSTANKIALWFYSVTWGGEYLMMRYLWQAGIDLNLQPSREDWYLNGTFGPVNGDIHERMTTDYHITAWNDKQAYNNPTWMLEPQNPDYTAERITDQYISYFDPYYMTYYGNTYLPARLCYAPGQVNYGKNVHYWQTPMDWNLASYESLTIKLPMSSVGWGLVPYWSNNYSVPGNAVGEMQAHGGTGEWVLGHGYPSTLYSTTYYDPATKTITIPPGSTWALNPNPGYPSICESGSPLFYFDLSPVSHYNMSIVQPGPYYAGVTYNLRVTPLNLSNQQTYCNQTVQLPAVAGVTYGASTHTFAWNESSWNTTIIFSTAGSFTLTSRDAYFYLDIVDTASYLVNPAIPEFPTLLIPIIGAVAIFAVFGKRKSKK